MRTGVAGGAPNCGARHDCRDNEQAETTPVVQAQSKSRRRCCLLPSIISIIVQGPARRPSTMPVTIDLSQTPDDEPEEGNEQSVLLGSLRCNVRFVRPPGSDLPSAMCVCCLVCSSAAPVRIRYRQESLLTPSLFTMLIHFHRSSGSATTTEWRIRENSSR
jgi:hypothetical protein